MPKTVLILGNRDDEHAVHVADRLAERGVRVGWLDGQAFPGDLRIAFEPGTTGHLVLADGGEKIPFDEIESVYWRCYSGPSFPDLPNAEQAELAYQDSRCLFESLLIELPARWVNGWAGSKRTSANPQRSRASGASP